MGPPATGRPGPPPGVPALLLSEDRGVGRPQRRPVHRCRARAVPLGSGARSPAASTRWRRRDLVTAQEVVDGATGRAASVQRGGLPRPAEPAAFGMSSRSSPADQLFDGHCPMMPSASETEVLDGARPTWQHLVVAGHQEHRPGSVDPFVPDLPKAELHVHLEGTLEPEMLFELGERNGISLPYADLDAVRRAYVFDNLRSFLDVYYASCAVLIKEEDFFELTRRVSRPCRWSEGPPRRGLLDPQTHTGRGIDIGTVVTGIHRALEHGQERLGISWRMIPCFLRHLDAGAAMDTLSQILPYRRWIDVVGLDSSEMGNPPSKFAQVFDRARSEGLLCVAHAGEEGPPEYIWEALDLLRVRSRRPRRAVPGRPSPGGAPAGRADPLDGVPTVERPFAGVSDDVGAHAAPSSWPWAFGDGQLRRSGLLRRLCRRQSGGAWTGAGPPSAGPAGPSFVSGVVPDRGREGPSHPGRRRVRRGSLTRRGSTWVGRPVAGQLRARTGVVLPPVLQLPHEPPTGGVTCCSRASTTSPSSPMTPGA